MKKIYANKYSPIPLREFYANYKLDFPDALISQCESLFLPMDKNYDEIPYGLLLAELDQSEIGNMANHMYLPSGEGSLWGYYFLGNGKPFKITAFSGYALPVTVIYSSFPKSYLLKCEELARSCKIDSLITDEEIKKRLNAWKDSL